MGLIELNKRQSGGVYFIFGFSIKEMSLHLSRVDLDAIRHPSLGVATLPFPLARYRVMGCCHSCRSRSASFDMMLRAHLANALFFF